MPEIAQERTLMDGQMTYGGGAVSHLEPSLVNKDSFSWGKNVVIRGGFPRSRPGFRLVTLLPQGKVQGAVYFKHSVGSVVVAVGGRIYRCDVVGNRVDRFELVTPTRNSAVVPEMWMVQAGIHLVVQDGQNRPIIHDGSDTWRTEGLEVPVGKQMAFGNARLWVANRDSMVAGNLYGLSAESHLDFSDNAYLATGGAFVFPGEVTALGFLPRINAVTAQGELMVFTRRTTSAVRADIYDRSLWQDTPGMQRLVFPSIGCESHRSLIAANQDLFFRSSDGIRSFRSTANDVNDAANTAMSSEVARVVNSDTARWLRFISGVKFDNRLLFTAAPRIFEFGTGLNDHTHICDKILSLDLAPIVARGQESGQAWDGEWAGLHVVQLVTGEFGGVDRCFAVCLDAQGKNSLWEITKDNTFDVTWPDQTVQNATERIRKDSFVELRRMDFDNPFAWKSLERLELWFSDIVGPLDFKIYYRSELDPLWTEWDLGSSGYAFETCEISQSEADTSAPYCSPPNLASGSYRVRLRAPKDIQCSDGSGKLTRYGREFQIKIGWVGEARLNKVRVVAQTRDEAIRGECPT